MIGEVPKARMLRWLKWCRHQQFSWGVEPTTIGARYERLTTPITALRITDEEVMTRNCTKKLPAAYKNAPHRIMIVVPQAYGEAY